MGIGGVIGGIIGGELVEMGQSMMIFYVMSVLGFAIALSGCLMSRSIEASSDKVISMSLCSRVKLNLVEIKKGF